MKHESRIMVFAIIVLFMIHNSLFINPAFAQGDIIGQSRINPASPLYFLKSIREIVELKFAVTTNIKAIRELEFATRRVREVKSLSYTSRQDLIEPTLKRYEAHLQKLMGIANLHDEKSAAQLVQTITLHSNALQLVYDQVSDVAAKRSIRAVINSLSQWDLKLQTKLNSLNKYPLAQQITTSKISACLFLSKEASSSALTEVERAVLTERAQKCLKED